MADARVILCVFAHPDDESFMAAGVACKYAEEGARVALVTATLGEEGGAGDPPVCTKEELPAVREAELRRAVEILGHLIGCGLRPWGRHKEFNRPDRSGSRSSRKCFRRELSMR